MWCRNNVSPFLLSMNLIVLRGKIVLKMWKDTTPGINSISYSMIRCLSNDPKYRLLKCCNTCFLWRRGIPKNRKSYLTFPILNYSKSKDNIFNYRSITCKLKWEVESTQKWFLGSLLIFTNWWVYDTRLHLVFG